MSDRQNNNKGCFSILSPPSHWKLLIKRQRYVHCGNRYLSFLSNNHLWSKRSPDSQPETGMRAEWEREGLRWGSGVAGGGGIYFPCITFQVVIREGGSMDFRRTELCKRIVLEGQKKVSGGCQLAGHSPLPGTARPQPVSTWPDEIYRACAVVTGDLRGQRERQCSANASVFTQASFSKGTSELKWVKFWFNWVENKKKADFLG